MFLANQDYLKLPGSYLFSTVAKKTKAYTDAHPEAAIIRLGIGDVTQPLPPAVIDALHRAVDEMSRAETFRGYAPDLGYSFLREAIAENDFAALIMTAGSRSATRSIRSMWIPMSWRAGPGHTTRLQASGPM